jgi:hypothetical protein
MPENPAGSGQNRRALRIGTDDLPLHASQDETVFLAVGAGVHAPAP